MNTKLSILIIFLMISTLPNTASYISLEEYEYGKQMFIKAKIAEWKVLHKDQFNCISGNITDEQYDDKEDSYCNSVLENLKLCIKELNTLDPKNIKADIFSIRIRKIFDGKEVWVNYFKDENIYEDDENKDDLRYLLGLGQAAEDSLQKPFGWVE